MPTLLNPDRQVVNSRGDLLDHDRQNLLPALEQSVGDLFAYGQQLWDDMTAMRTYYLLHHQRPNPCDPQPVDQPQGAPVGGHQPTATTSGDAADAPDDGDGQAGWATWIDAYAAVTSVLGGPHSDSGFRIHEAHRLAGLRQRTP